MSQCHSLVTSLRDITKLLSRPYIEITIYDSIAHGQDFAEEQVLYKRSSNRRQLSGSFSQISAHRYYPLATRQCLFAGQH